MTPADRSEIVCQKAREMGFIRAGVAPVGPLARNGYIHSWLDNGRAGEMTYLERHRQLRENPAHLLPDARSVIVVADNYRQSRDDRGEPRSNDSTPRGRIARYAWGRDYHRVLRKKLHRLADFLRDQVEPACATRVCVDTAPIVEREVAAAAGIGWIGKNTMILHQEAGSFFFLGEIITTLELEPTAPATDHCGTCTRCLDACPTDAFPAPYQMDATRCISYLTIEHRSDIAESLHGGMGDWIYGCDICQDVCPFNRQAPATTEADYELQNRFPLTPAPLLSRLLELTPEDYARQLAGSAMKRASLDMLKRNARIAKSNQEPRSTSQAEG